MNRFAITLVAALLFAPASAASARADAAPAQVGTFVVPYCAFGIAVGPDGAIVLSDWYGGLVHVYSPTGTPLSTIGPVRVPTYLAFGPGGDLFVCEQGAQQVSEFTPQGALVRTIGGPGSGPGALTQPMGIGVDSHGTVYVADPVAARVTLYDAGGAFVTAWTIAGALPYGITVDRNDRVDVSTTPGGALGVFEFSPDGTPVGRRDVGFSCALAVDQRLDLLTLTMPGVVAYDPAGQQLWSMTYGPFPFGTCPGFPLNGIALSADGLLYVLSESQVFVYDDRATPTAHHSWGSLKARYR